MMLVLTVIVSGCTSETASDLVQQKGEMTTQKMLENLNQSQVSIEIVTAFSKEESLVLKLRNAGVAPVKSDEVTAIASGETSDCRNSDEVASGDIFDCQTSFNFPDAAKPMKIELNYNNTFQDNYTCIVDTSDSIAC